MTLQSFVSMLCAYNICALIVLNYVAAHVTSYEKFCAKSNQEPICSISSVEIMFFVMFWLIALPLFIAPRIKQMKIHKEARKIVEG